jgi:putative oxidoreductase
MNIERARTWTAERSDMWLDLLRIYIGVGLFAKGVSLAASREALFLGSATQLGWMQGMVAHYVIPVHIVGGLLLAIGLATRAAALANIPILLGAVFFVHAREGLFTTAQTLEFALLVLFMLCVFTIAGSGRVSVDHYIARHSSRGPLRRPSLA